MKVNKKPCLSKELKQQIIEDSKYEEHQQWVKDQLTEEEKAVFGSNYNGAWDDYMNDLEIEHERTGN
jgi:hypothetical protein